MEPTNPQSPIKTWCNTFRNKEKPEWTLSTVTLLDSDNYSLFTFNRRWFFAMVGNIENHNITSERQMCSQNNVLINQSFRNTFLKQAFAKYHHQNIILYYCNKITHNFHDYNLFIFLYFHQIKFVHWSFVSFLLLSKLTSNSFFIIII